MSDTDPIPAWPAEDHHCAPCDLHYAHIGPAEVRETAGAAADLAGAAVRDITRAAGPEALRRRPAPGVWSALEYVCHLRDVYAVYTVRLHRARTEHRPALEPMLNELRARRFGYNRLPPAAVLTELRCNAEGLRAELDRARDLDRPVRRRPGEQRTARWLARQVLHETRHHLDDLRGGTTEGGAAR
ncbi:MAG TPA: DinB family protein [Pseudonocardia sp.]